MLGGTHVAWLAGWVGKVFIKCCLQSKFHSILTSRLFPGALVSTPPCTPSAPSLWGFVSLSLCNPCPELLSTGDSISCLCFLSPSSPWLRLKSIPGPFQTLLCLGLVRQAGGGPSWAHLLFTRPPAQRLPHPHPMPDWPALANTMGQLPNLAFLLFLSKVLHRPSPLDSPWGAPPHPGWGLGSETGFQ